jgi:hypothetical protein
LTAGSASTTTDDPILWNQLLQSSIEFRESKRRLSFNAKLGRLHDFGLFPRWWQSYFAITRHSFTVIGEAVVIDRQHYKEVTAVWTFAVLSGEFVGPDNPFLTMWARNKDHNKIRSKMKSPLIRACNLQVKFVVGSLVDGNRVTLSS